MPCDAHQRRRALARRNSAYPSVQSKPSVHLPSIQNQSALRWPYAVLRPRAPLTFLLTTPPSFRMLLRLLCPEPSPHAALRGRPLSQLSQKDWPRPPRLRNSLESLPVLGTAVSASVLLYSCTMHLAIGFWATFPVWCGAGLLTTPSL